MSGADKDGIIRREVTCPKCDGDTFEPIQVAKLRFNVLDPRNKESRQTVPGLMVVCVDCGTAIDLEARILEMMDHPENPEARRIVDA